MSSQSQDRLGTNTRIVPYLAVCEAEIRRARSHTTIVFLNHTQSIIEMLIGFYPGDTLVPELYTGPAVVREYPLPNRMFRAKCKEIVSECDHIQRAGG